MLDGAAQVSVMKVVMIMLMILGTGVEAAPTERGKEVIEITSRSN